MSDLPKGSKEEDKKTICPKASPPNIPMAEVPRWLISGLGGPVAPVFMTPTLDQYFLNTRRII